jgi:hypothetical protein
MKDRLKFAVAMAQLLFEMRIESGEAYGDDDAPVPIDFANAIVDDATHIYKIKEGIAQDIFRTISAYPNKFYNGEKECYEYETDIYDYAFYADSYVQDLYDAPQRTADDEFKAKKEKIVNHLFEAARGYGMAETNGTQSHFDVYGNYLPEGKGSVTGGKLALAKCIDSIPADHLNDFIYTLQRIAEKSGEDGFDWK